MLQSLHTRLSSGISSHSCVVESTRVLGIREGKRKEKRKEIIREERMKSRDRRGGRSGEGKEHTCTVEGLFDINA